MPSNLPSVIKVSIVAHGILFVEFHDGTTGTLDLTPFLGFGVLSMLKDPGIFSQVKVAFGTLEWPGGVDLDPEWLYEKFGSRMSLKHPGIIKLNS